MNHVENFVNNDTLRTMYFTMIHPHLVYGITLWGKTADKGLSRLIKLQKRAIRIICKSNKLDHASPRLRKLGILGVQELFELQTSLLVFDCLQNNVQDSLKNLFSFIGETGRPT